MTRRFARAPAGPLVAGLLLALVAACGRPEPSAPVGSHGGPCTPGGGCDPGLVCRDDVCVAQPDPGMCDGVTCADHGACVESDAGPACECEAGWQAVGLTCVEETAGTHDVPLSWAEPTTNEDGSPLTDLAGYRLYWGASPAAYTEHLDLGLPSCTGGGTQSRCAYTLTGLPAGTWYFTVTAYNDAGDESLFSNEVTTTF